MRVALAGLALTVVVIEFGAIICAAARHVGWTLGPIYLGVLAASFMVNVACLLIWNPVVLKRRMVLGRGVKAWDWIWATLIVAIYVALVIVAVLDLRGRAPSPPGIVWLIGWTIFIAGWTLINWSMVINPFFEKLVRIQTNHGHHVIDRGPYAYIRHPGYVGFSAVILSTPLLLASAWTLLPALMAVVMFVIRTALEDRALQAELPGYREYAERVRFRLIPGVW